VAPASRHIGNRNKPAWRRGASSALASGMLAALAALAAVISAWRHQSRRSGVAGVNVKPRRASIGISVRSR